MGRISSKKPKVSSNQAITQLLRDDHLKTRPYECLWCWCPSHRPTVDRKAFFWWLLLAKGWFRLSHPLGVHGEAHVFWDGFLRLGSVQRNLWWKSSYIRLNPDIKDVSSTVTSPNELTSQRHFIFSRRKMSLHEFTFPSMRALLFLVNAHHGCVQTHRVMREAHPWKWWGCSLPCCWF